MVVAKEERRDPKKKIVKPIIKLIRLPNASERGP